MAAEAQKFVLQPGVNRQASQTAWEGGWWDASLVRWRQGMPEKWGGWVRLGQEQAPGVPRSLLSWFLLVGDPVLAVGTNERLMLRKGNALFDVTPVNVAAPVSGGISTVSGSATVTLVCTVPHGAAIGDYVVLPAVTVGGIPLGVGADGFGAYRITSVPAPDQVTFEAQVAASSTVSGGGGSITAKFLYPVGAAGAVAGRGWGAGAWSRGTWSSPASVPVTSGDMRFWSLAKWGERLLSVPNGGPLFAWAPGGGGAIDSRAARIVNAKDGTVLRVDVTAGGSGYTSAPTVTLSGGGGSGATATAEVIGGAVTAVLMGSPGSGYTSAPTVSFSGGGGSGAAATAVLEPIRSPPLRNTAVVVGSTERQVILLGSSRLGSDLDFDPMLVRWSDVDDYSNFLASSQTSAGARRAQDGSRLVAGMNLTLVTLIWSDTALHQMRFVGAPYWYSMEVLGRNCGLVGPGAAGELGGSVYWMGRDAFWMWRGGAPQQIDCPLFEDVFGVLNRDQASRVACGTNVEAGEVLWFYPGEGSAECDRCVVFNTLEGVWYPARISRTAWLESGAFHRPIAAVSDGRLFQHETGVDADGEAMGEFAETGYIDIGDGDAFTFVSRIIPDWQRLSGAVQIYVKVQDEPGKAPWVRGPFTVWSSTRFVGTRARGRQMALRIEGVGTGGDWRLGAMRAFAGAAGRR